MLAADKLLLQSSLKQNAIQLKEKELNLHNANFGSLGTQSAVLAGFAVTALIEFTFQREDTLKIQILEMLYYIFCTLSLVANLYCVAGSTILSVFATNLALRGPDGSVERAVEGMHEERRNIFVAFALGLTSLLTGMVFGAWLLMSASTALISTSIIIYGGYCTYKFGKRTAYRFSFREDHSEIDDFIQNFVARIPRPLTRTSGLGSTDDKKQV
ncbi:hypothetical protein AAMO2058_000240100 [Amorphochlora amoebiformis]